MRTSYPKKEIKAFLEKEYGLKNISQLKLLTLGIDNSNFLVKAGLKNKARKFVLKIYEFSGFPQVKFEMAFLKFCKKKGLPVQNVFTTKKGKEIVVFHKKPAVLVEYLEGKPLCETRITSALMKKLGILIARFHNATKISRLKGSTRKKHYWEIMGFLLNAEFLKDVKDRKHKLLLTRVIKEYKAIKPLLHKCRKMTIHNDFNSENVLLMPSGKLGVIDFGDAITTVLVNDIAVAIASMCFRSKDSLRLARSLYQEYNKRFPLTVIEKQLLFDIIKARFATAALYCSHEIVLHGKHKNFTTLIRWGIKNILLLENIGKETFDRKVGIL